MARGSWDKYLTHVPPGTLALVVPGTCAHNGINGDRSKAGGGGSEKIAVALQRPWSLCLIRLCWPAESHCQSAHGVARLNQFNSIIQTAVNTALPLFEAKRGSSISVTSSSRINVAGEVSALLLKNVLPYKETKRLVVVKVLLGVRRLLSGKS